MSSLGFNHIDEANSNFKQKELYDGSHLWIYLPSQLSSVADSNRQALRVTYFHLRLCHIEVAYFHKSCLFSRELPIFTKLLIFICACVTFLLLVATNMLSSSPVWLGGTANPSLLSVSRLELLNLGPLVPEPGGEVLKPYV